MERNKEEAIKAKEMAERKFSERDYAGAKTFVLKALSLFPALEGLSQFITTLDVLISAENKINGEMDWYGILGLTSFANEETIKKHYRNLALNLHPDKNKSPGAESAFKLVSDAWSLLSDKIKRLAYNQTRSSEGFQHNAPIPQYTMAGTFWTTCDGCGTHFQFYSVYMNQILKCPTCGHPFEAIEKGPPTHMFSSPDSSSQQHPQNPSQQHPSVGRNHPMNPGRTSAVSQNLQSSFPTGTSFNNTNIQWGPQSSMAGSVRRDGSSSVAAANVKQKSRETRREGEGIPSIAALEKSHKHKKSSENPTKKIKTDLSTGKANMGTERTHLSTGTDTKDDRVRELAPFEIRNMLMNKAQTEIRKKLQEMGSVAEPKTANKGQKSAFHDKIGAEKRGGSAINRNRQVGSVLATPHDAVQENPGTVTINVPDSDFHKFDLDRTANSFAADQVWVAYDDDDGMPRYYAKIQKVVSRRPFRMQISWLNSRRTSELGPLDWVGSGFTKTCGDFRPGKHEITSSLNSFSHKVRWTKGARGTVRIFPGKGEIWAVYRNWSPDWNETTPDEVIHKYDMVEVLEDFNEEEGVLVTPLVKVDGFRSVFRRQNDDLAIKIPKVELFRFSHQVPNYCLTGEEAHNAPKGCRELDPAATSSDLVQTTAEANVVLDNIGRMMEHTFLGSPENRAAAAAAADKGGENASKP